MAVFVLSQLWQVALVQMPVASCPVTRVQLTLLRPVIRHSWDGWKKGWRYWCHLFSDVQRDETFETDVLASRPAEIEILASWSKLRPKFWPWDWAEMFDLKTMTMTETKPLTSSLIPKFWSGVETNISGLVWLCLASGVFWFDLSFLLTY